MRVTFISLFPDFLRSYFQKGVLSRALENELVDFSFINLRDYAQSAYKEVDDYPYGDRTGMLIRSDIVMRALNDIDDIELARLVFPCPQGPAMSDGMAREFSTCDHMVVLCGYYEGVDQRVFDLMPFERVSFGEAVLTSGELPALALVDATLRYVKGVVGKDASVYDDSYSTGVLEGPQYTTPREVGEMGVPEVLVSGHHSRIAEWRRKGALKETLYSKPSLLTQLDVNDDDQRLLEDIIKEE